VAYRGLPTRAGDHDAKLRAIADAHAAALARDGDPVDLDGHSDRYVDGPAPVSNVYAATAEESPEAHERRRPLIRDSVERITAE
jgi:hypothetical protein